MSGFTRRIDAPGPKKKAARKRSEKSLKVEKKPKGKTTAQKTQKDSITRGAQSRETGTSQETVTGLDTRDNREG